METGYANIISHAYATSAQRPQIIMGVTSGNSLVIIGLPVCLTHLSKFEPDIASSLSLSLCTTTMSISCE